MADDLERYNQIKEQLKSQRDPESRSPFIDRGNEESYQRVVREKEDSSILSRIAQIGGLGLGAYLIAKKLPNDIWAEAINKLGVYGRDIAGRFVEARDAMVLGQSAVSYAKRGTSELARFLDEQANPFLKDIEIGSSSTTARQTALDLTRKQLEDKFGRSFPGLKKYTGLTVQDILRLKANQGNAFNVLSDNAYASIIDTRAKLDPRGTWFDKLLVDNNLYRSKLDPNQILDTRWSSLGNIGRSLQNSLGFQIPFVGFRPIDLINPFVKMFSEGPQFARVGIGQTLEKGITTPRYGTNYLIGGKLFNFSATGVEAIAKDRVFRAQTIDKFAEANLARIGRLPTQNLPVVNGIPQNRQSFFNKLQDFIGIGPRFRTQPFVAAELINRIEERRAILSGRAKFRLYPNIEAHDLPFVDKLKLQLETEAAGRIYNPGEIIPSPYASGRPVPFFKKVLANFGDTSIGRVVDTNAPNKTLRTKGWFTGTEANRLNPSIFGIRQLRPGELTKTFEQGLYTGIEHSIYENTIQNKISILGHFFTNRLNTLIGATTGIGFKPTAGQYGWLLNSFKIAAIGHIFNPVDGYAVDAISYVNYLFSQVTNLFGIAPWSGFSPSDIALQTYKGITLGAAKAKDLLGITAAAKYSEDLMPGSVKSPLSGIARTTIPAYLLGMRFGGKGILAGLAGAGLTGGISDIFGTNDIGAGLATSYDELKDLYSGKTFTPIRKSRWWMLGRQNFYGEGIDRYEPHWVKKAESDYEFSNVLYGSRREYFKHASRLPTPHNLFGLLSDSNYYGNKLSSSRPYPVDASGNPTHGGEIAPFNQSLPRGISPEDLNALGYGIPKQYTYPVGSESSLSFKVKDKLDVMSEFLGIYKFIGKTILGRPDTEPVLESSSNITDKRRLYWDKDLGGLFGMTELLRRYIPKPNNLGVDEYVNNIPNQMPDFMPGMRSSYEQDRQYPIDFTLGDPYSKISGGEYRLPGPGYEAINKLHSGQKGVYDPVDALLILSDVAPFSKAYKDQKSIVSKMSLDPFWEDKVQQSEKYREDKIQGFSLDFARRKFTNQDSIGQLNARIKYNAVERLIGSAWENITLDALPELGRVAPFGTLITHKLFPHHTAEQDYLERVVLGTRNSNWANPMEGFIAPKYRTLVNEDPLTAAIGGLGTAFTATTPAGMLSRGLIGSLTMAGASSIRALEMGKLEGGYKPSDRIEEEQITDYFDKLEYLRYQNSINRAKAIGRNDIASNFTKLQKSNTLVGLNLMQPARLKIAYNAIPKQERSYYNSFINASDSEKQNILEMAPSYMDEIYQSIWQPGSVKRDTTSTIKQFMNNNNVPGKDWEGWNPGINKWQLVTKTMDTPSNSISVDLHRQFISNAMIQQTDMGYPNIGLNLQDLIGNTTTENNIEWHSQTREKVNTTHSAIRSGYKNVRVNTSYDRSNDQSPYYNSRLRYNRRYEKEAYIKENIR